MKIGILRIHKIIIIIETSLPLFASCIIRRIYINYIYLAGVSIRQFSKSGEVVALDNEVIGSIGVIRYYRVDFIVVALDEDREVFAKTFLDVFGLFFPYKPVLLVSSYEFKQRGFFLVAQPIKGLYLSSKFCLVHWQKFTVIKTKDSNEIALTGDRPCDYSGEFPYML